MRSVERLRTNRNYVGEGCGLLNHTPYVIKGVVYETISAYGFCVLSCYGCQDCAPGVALYWVIVSA